MEGSKERRGKRRDGSVISSRSSIRLLPYKKSTEVNGRRDPPFRVVDLERPVARISEPVAGTKSRFPLLEDPRQDAIEKAIIASHHQYRSYGPTSPTYESHGPTSPIENRKKPAKICIDELSVGRKTGNLPRAVNRAEPSKYRARDLNIQTEGQRPAKKGQYKNITRRMVNEINDDLNEHYLKNGNDIQNQACLSMTNESAGITKHKYCNIKSTMKFDGPEDNSVSSLPTVKTAKSGHRLKGLSDNTRKQPHSNVMERKSSRTNVKLPKLF